MGAESAKKLCSRFADLRAAANVTELVAGRPHPLKKDRKGQYAVDLAGGKRLAFKPTDQPAPSLDDGSIDWGNVARITIVYIGDYHD